MTDLNTLLANARSHIEATLLEKAASDAAFRELLKANPHAALLAHFGSDPVPSMKITVIEEAAGEVTLVLPRQIAEDELPDDLLDYAAGGAFKGCKGDGWTLDKLNRMGIS
ncbi:NHLP leader peptide family natural product precursor [Pannonibacter sp.]|uniref:NHLP leader peptide family natural product precursor n=1 Tax=Pannonibacter sp. TaxID=1906786 RepID=UPI003F705BD4